MRGAFLCISYQCVCALHTSSNGGHVCQRLSEEFGCCAGALVGEGPGRQHGAAQRAPDVSQHRHLPPLQVSHPLRLDERGRLHILFALPLR